MGLFDKIGRGLAKTRDSFKSGVKSIFSGGVDEDFFEELEEALILADVGVSTSIMLAEKLRAKAKAEHIKEREQLWAVLKEEIRDILGGSPGGLSLQYNELNIILFTGVNGAGKTTTIGKLGAKYAAEGKKVLLAAADTYRAAAAEQLQGWADRSDLPLIRQDEGADPAAVVFDAISAARARKVDVLLVDTAGRLQNKTNLMNELGKIGRVIAREAPDAALESLLVVDGGTGQSAIQQALQFGEVVPLNGVVITKLDGSAKGGSLIGIVNESRLPIKLVGVGEGIDDLQDFDGEQFIAALFAD